MNTKLALSLTILLLITTISSSSATSLTDQCSESFQKVAGCLNYATGKANTPAKDCCTSVQQIINTQAVCMCYVILEVHNGSENAKSLGLRESRLLQLPSACNMPNGILSNCPKLLNISSTSSDYGIFTNATSSPSTGSTRGSSSSTATKDNSFAFKSTPSLLALVAIFVSVSSFFSAPSHWKLYP